MSKTPLKFKKVKQISVPLSKLVPNEDVICQFQGSFRMMMLDAGKDLSPALLARVYYPETDEIKDLVCSTVMMSTLEKMLHVKFELTEEKAVAHFEMDLTSAEYADSGYVYPLTGKYFLLECTKRDDKGYNDVMVTEIELEDE